MISKNVLGSDQFKYSHITLHAGPLQFIFTDSSHCRNMTRRGSWEPTSLQGFLFSAFLEREPGNKVDGEQNLESLLYSGAYVYVVTGYAEMKCCQLNLSS